MKRHLAWFVLVAACSRHPHVQLGPLPPDLTPGQRVQTYNDLRATFEETRVTRSCSNQGGCSTSINRTLFLANGTRVYHPEDLLPIVATDSAAARSARAAMRSEQARRNFTLVGVAGMLLFAIAGASFISDDDGDVSTGIKLGVYGGGAAAVVGAFGSYYHYQKAADEHGEANAHYNEGLARQLKICINGVFVAPCEASP